LACEATPVLAHRGHPAQAENSVAAVQAAATARGFAGAEIDVQMLAGNDQWALHHDILPGRVAQLSDDKPLRLLTAAEWGTVTLRDQARGSTGRAATLDAALQALPAQRPAGWRLWIEVKDFPSADQARGLVRLVASYLPLQAVTFTSISSVTLGHLRDAAPDAQLAWVLLPSAAAMHVISPRAWAMLRKDGQRVGLAAGDVEFALRSGERFERDATLPATAMQQLGPRLSVLMDLEMVAARPEVARRARAAGMGVAAYLLRGGDKDLARLLARLQQSQSFWPDAIVAGTPVDDLCAEVLAAREQLVVAPPAPETKPASPPAPSSTPAGGSGTRPAPPAPPASASEPYFFRWDPRPR
jgi:glycerophosphoryl diester phosphodiesterase